MAALVLGFWELSTDHGHCPVASGQAVAMCGQTVETVGHWVWTDVPHSVTVPGWMVGPQAVLVGHRVVRVGQVVSCIGHWVCTAGQTVGCGAHSVGTPGVMVGPPQVAGLTGHWVVTCGQVVC